MALQWQAMLDNVASGNHSTNIATVIDAYGLSVHASPSETISDAYSIHLFMSNGAVTVAVYKPDEDEPIAEVVLYEVDTTATQQEI